MYGQYDFLSNNQFNEDEDNESDSLSYPSYEKYFSAKPKSRLGRRKTSGHPSQESGRSCQTEELKVGLESNQANWKKSPVKRVDSGVSALTHPLVNRQTPGVGSCRQTPSLRSECFENIESGYKTPCRRNIFTTTPLRPINLASNGQFQSREVISEEVQTQLNNSFLGEAESNEHIPPAESSDSGASLTSNVSDDPSKIECRSGNKSTCGSKTPNKSLLFYSLIESPINPLEGILVNKSDGEVVVNENLHRTLENSMKATSDEPCNKYQPADNNVFPASCHNLEPKISEHPSNSHKTSDNTLTDQSITMTFVDCLDFTKTECDKTLKSNTQNNEQKVLPDNRINMLTGHRHIEPMEIAQKNSRNEVCARDNQNHRKPTIVHGPEGTNGLRTANDVRPMNTKPVVERSASAPGYNQLGYHNDPLKQPHNIKPPHPPKSSYAPKVPEPQIPPKKTLPPTAPSHPKENPQFKVPLPVVKPTPQHFIYVNKKPFSALSLLGRGGSSEVYQVIDPVTSRLMAVKCVNLSSVDETIAKGYLNEIELLSKLQGCSSVIRMYDHEFVKDSRLLYVVMEKGDVDLARLMKGITKTKEISLSMIIYYWTEMLTVVKDIHDNGIIHSDLKPANFLLVGGRLKLIDFGIASSLQGDMTSVMKEVTTGTFNYMSPEAIRYTSDTNRGYKISYKSDIWSLGCILFNMLYGRTPFSHINNTWAKLQAIADLDQQIEFPNDDRGIPVALIHAMKWCLKKDPKLRPTTSQLLQIPYHMPPPNTPVGAKINALMNEYILSNFT